VSDIQRYVVLDVDGNQGSGEYDTLDEAREAAQSVGGAVEAHVYEWSDSELVWTPDGGNEWPPPPPMRNPALDENGDWRTCDTHGGAITQDCQCVPAAWMALTLDELGDRIEREPDRAERNRMIAEYDVRIAIARGRWSQDGGTCPCGSSEHVLATHPNAERYGFTEFMGRYLMDDPIAEHRDGEHDAHPDPDSCAACAALGDG